MTRTIIPYLLLLFLLESSVLFAQNNTSSDIQNAFLHPPASAKPWVFWYWMNGAVSKEGITADLEAMKEVGIGGAYLMTIKDTSSAIPFQPTVRQLTPEWWAMIKFAMQEAKRLNLQLAMHVSDGFALAGGPWITPELSMQKLVWTKTYISAPFNGTINLQRPSSYKGYYKDVAVFAYPANYSSPFNDKLVMPNVTTSNGTNGSFLPLPDSNNKESFKSDTASWIQYQYAKPFTCRSIRIHTGSNNYQALRLIVEAGNDGVNFKNVTRLEPPRHGWQDTDEDYSYAIPATTATYFRFVYNKEGSEPGAEDLDAAKWKPSLKLMGIYLSAEPVINQYEAKNGSVWRVAAPTTLQELDDTDAIPVKNIIDLTDKLDNKGNLNWTKPPGDWIVVRIGHTSTGQTNATGGAAKGLECDKFNANAVKLQFDNWFAKAFEKTDPALAKQVMKIFHVDSWECGSQNWSDNFAAEFKKRRGYDLMPYLLVMTGIPVESVFTSEKVLLDVRTTIAELVNDIFYVTLKNLAHAKGCRFSAESIAPTFVSDGLLHYKNADIPMGEFWLNSPTHDKPTDMLDAISGGHIYGKNIIQAEAFTSVRMNWGEAPGNMKIVGDRNFALGVNKMVIHVFTHNPWLDRNPGMTLDGVGLYFQRDQTWFKQGKAWIDYLTRCQAILQLGKPVVDIGVFIGEEVPRRSLLPDRLVNSLPGIFGQEKVEREKKRLENVGEPLRQIPDGVVHSANMTDPEDWIDPLNGYAYDCFNPDVLLTMKFVNGRIVTPGGASYKLLLVPSDNKMNPTRWLSNTSLNRLLALVKSGAVVLIDAAYRKRIELLQPRLNERNGIALIGMGKIIFTPYLERNFVAAGVAPDFESNGERMAWNHRKINDKDIYFVSNPDQKEKTVLLSFNVQHTMPQIFDPVNGKINAINDTAYHSYRQVKLKFAASQSFFIVFDPSNKKLIANPKPASEEISVTIDKEWDLVYRGTDGNVKHFITNTLRSWTSSPDPVLKYYSGTAVYQNTFTVTPELKNKTVSIKLDSIYDLATVKINGINCGTLWTRPYELDITRATRQGENKLEIQVTNTWHNRLIGDNLLPADKKITWTTAPFRLKDKPLLPAGLVGNVKIIFR